MMDESNIPIDINIGKLQDWLVSRRHVNKEWQKNILSVRKKINIAIQDMPAHEGIAALLSGSYINYFHCQKIVDILKETEADSRNLFGRYGSQRMKDWQEILKCYEKENIYLAEASQMLFRNITYEIPSLKKQIVKEEQIQVECEKKYAEYIKNEASSKAEFQITCKQLGIKGEKIRQELLERLCQLPDIYDKIGKSLKSLTPAIKLYSAFMNYKLLIEAPQVLPLLQFVVEHGNATVYEWSYGEPPLKVEPDPCHIDFDDEVDHAHGDQIDFEDNEIDFGSLDNLPNVTDSGAEIDWGNIESCDDQLPVEVDVSNISLDESGIVLESQGLSGGVAQGDYALTILDNPVTRNEFLDQLFELESFLKMRLYETSAHDTHSFSLIEDLPSESNSTLADMLDVVQVAVSKITSGELSHLHNVKHSPRYVDSLSLMLNQKRLLSKKMTGLAEATNMRRNTANERATMLRPLLERLVHNSKQLQVEIEKDISKKYKGRPVNIIGGVKFL